MIQLSSDLQFCIKLTSLYGMDPKTFLTPRRVVPYCVTTRWGQGVVKVDPRYHIYAHTHTHIHAQIRTHTHTHTFAYEQV